MEHLRTIFLIVEQGRFLGHHEVFGRRVMLPLDNEPGLEPLAEARSRNGNFAALVPPEKRKRQMFSRVETGAQFFHMFRVVQ
ncbi:hypothetical protein D3C78_1395900 [compost metagenome]